MVLSSRSKQPPVIQSITIPSHTSEPPAPTLYHIRITTPTSTYTSSHRYNDFATLHTTLSSLSPPPPVPLPPKRVSYFRSTLTPAETTARQAQLEAYLRAILAHPDPTLSHSPAFLDFLAPPVLSSSNGAAGVNNRTAPTPQTWLHELSTLQAATHELRTTLTDRDVLASSSTTSAASHALTKSSKTLTVELLASVEQLKDQLKGLGLPSGEETRRSKMVVDLETELAKLARPLHSAPNPVTAGFGSGSKGEVGGGSIPGGFVRPSRTLGRPAVPAVETATTRALDNQGLMQLQQTYMATQDDRVNDLAASLRKQRELGVLIGQELAVQDETLTALDQDVDKVSKNMKRVDGQMRRLG